MGKSTELFERAVRVMPGGVNSPVRAYKAVGGNPLFIDRADGSGIYDADGNGYIDYVCSWGPMILGHNNSAIRNAVTDAAQKGLSYGAPVEAEINLAEKIIMLTGVEMVRMVNSGTEAVMSALRLARAYTGRRKVIKFEGCYHGHADSMLVKAGSGALTTGMPDSLGVGDSVAADTLVASYNDLETVLELLKNYETACVIVEPAAANMGVILPKEGFLSGLRELCNTYGALLVFDEVITGFRLGLGGAQEYYGVRADLVVYGKIIGGGMPVGAYGGKREIMEYISPIGPVYQAGTLSGNPIAMAAGLAQLAQLEKAEQHEMHENHEKHEKLENHEKLEKYAVYWHINRMGARLSAGFSDIVRHTGLKACVNQVGSLCCLFFGIEAADDFQSVKKADTEQYAQYFREMLNKGVYLAPSQYEAMFISFAHTEKDIDETLNKAESVFRSLISGQCH